jgi:hypothetical protein
MKATVLYMKDTGQVMAAVTRVALVEAPPADDPDAVPPEVLALVGDALPVRSFINVGTGFPDAATFAIPAEQLAALTVDVDQDQLLSPRGYVVVDDKKLELPQAGAPPIAAAANNGSTLGVTLATVTPIDLPVALHVLPAAGATGRPQVLEGVFRAGPPPAPTVNFNLSAPLSGTYTVLMLVRGYPARSQVLTV